MFGVAFENGVVTLAKMLDWDSRDIFSIIGMRALYKANMFSWLTSNK